MEIIRYTSPYDYEKVLALIEQTFGAWEAQLELPQMNGDEAEQNTDWIYVAIEDGQILGTVHATIPKKMPKYCGVSGVCTVPAARGTAFETIFSDAISSIPFNWRLCSISINSKTLLSLSIFIFLNIFFSHFYNSPISLIL